jgi:hypothetical protein
MAKSASEAILAAVSSSLFVFGEGYQIVADEVLFYEGRRPGPDWHRHGTFATRRYMVVREKLRRFTVLKQRWCLNDRSATRHSRPPDDLGLQYDALIVALKLWTWLNAGLGLHRYVEILPALEGKVASRTLQRWLHRTLPRSLEIQHAIRAAVIERCEPRPLETLFPGGLSPPGTLTRLHWKEPTTVGQLWRGLTFLFEGAIRLGISAAPLLAEARGRLNTPNHSQR